MVCFMRRFAIWALLASLFAFASCGVSNAPVKTTTSKPAEAYLAFSADTQDSIVVTVDGREYRMETLKVKGSTNEKDLREMAGNIITLTPGTHEVSVKNKKGEQVYRQKITVSAQEHKMIKL